MLRPPGGGCGGGGCTVLASRPPPTVLTSPSRLQGRWRQGCRQQVGGGGGVEAGGNVGACSGLTAGGNGGGGGSSVVSVLSLDLIYWSSPAAPGRRWRRRRGSCRGSSARPARRAAPHLGSPSLVARRQPVSVTVAPAAAAAEPAAHGVGSRALLKRPEACRT